MDSLSNSRVLAGNSKAKRSRVRGGQVYQSAVGRGAMKMKVRARNMRSPNRYPQDDQIEQRLDNLRSQMKKKTGREMNGPVILTHKKPIV